jgi:IS30 family transposase
MNDQASGGKQGRPIPLRRLRRQFWLLIRAGNSRVEAAAALGFRGNTGQRWFRQAGGVVPAYVRTQPSSRGRYLSLEEREDIHAGIERGDSIRQIARCLGRAHTTVLRELRRNLPRPYRSRRAAMGKPRPGPPKTTPWGYRPSVAQSRAEFRARRLKPAKLATNQQLHDLVQIKLSKFLSPEQIAAQLRREFPANPEMWVSHETIYQSIYVQGRGALRRELAVCLRTGRALRKPRRKPDERRGRIPGMVNISERPPEADDRFVPGHWEGDLIIGKNGQSAIGTLVERRTRFLMLLHLPNHDAEAVQEAMIAATRRLPQSLWKSLTWDQGFEMRRHAQISMATGLEIYFCDPGKPWQRGSNENTNGLLRQYFPKGTDLSVHSPEHLEFVADQMNTRPRKTLGWMNPAEALAQLLSEASDQPGGATTD